MLKFRIAPELFAKILSLALKKRKSRASRQDKFLDLTQVLLSVKVQLLNSRLHTSWLAMVELMVTRGKYNFNLDTNA
jgi:hypothetical protein